MSTQIQIPDNTFDAIARLSADVAATEGEGGALFMKFTKQGTWEYGPDSEVAEEDALWAIHPAGFAHGFIAWFDDDSPNSGVADERMVPLTSAPVDESTLPQVNGATWRRQLQVQLVCLTGEDQGTKVVYATTSKGGLRAVQTVLKSLMTRQGKAEIVPVVKLEESSYQHKKYGRIFVPEINVVKFIAPDDLMEPVDEEPAPEQAPEPEPEPERRRRRRRG